MPLEMLYGYLDSSEGGRCWYVDSASEALDIVTHNDIHAVIIEPGTFTADNTALLAFKLRLAHPEVGIVLLTDDNEFEQLFGKATPSVRHRLSHYFRLSRSAKYPKHSIRHGWPDPTDLHEKLSHCQQWYATHVKKHGRQLKYKYDVALSFAGEDRVFADELADSLRWSGVRVFYDSFEQADLWGKDLFTHLYNVYANDARFCIVLVSENYVNKRWTVHERRSAQERVLNERDSEYLLPVRLDLTPLPGLPGTVAYLDGSRGVHDIARLFIRKLGNVLSEAHS